MIWYEFELWFFWAMSLAHRAMSISYIELNPMYELWSYHDNKMNPMYGLWSCHDNGFIIDELCYIISSMTFIMPPTTFYPLTFDAHSFNITGPLHWWSYECNLQIFKYCNLELFALCIINSPSAKYSMANIISLIWGPAYTAHFARGQRLR